MQEAQVIGEVERKIILNHRRYRLGDHPLTREIGLQGIVDTLASITDKEQLEQALSLLENPTLEQPS